MSIFNHIVILLTIIAICLLPFGAFGSMVIYMGIAGEWDSWRRKRTAWRHR